MLRILTCILMLQMMCCVVYAANRLPNILFIFADDLGWTDVGYQGDGYLETPRIDQLAHEGMVFSNAYAAAGNCAPSRACLLSGSYTPRHHVFAVWSTNRGPKDLMRLKPIPNKSGLRENVVTIADALRQAGYAGAFSASGTCRARTDPTPANKDSTSFIILSEKARFPKHHAT